MGDSVKDRIVAALTGLNIRANELLLTMPKNDHEGDKGGYHSIRETPGPSRAEQWNQLTLVRSAIKDLQEALIHLAGVDI